MDGLVAPALWGVKNHLSFGFLWASGYDGGGPAACELSRRVSMMTLFRKSVILAHRYLGIALSLLFVVWFASGITMMYAGGMPRLVPDERLERLPPLDLSAVRLTPAEAAQKADVDAGQTTLLTVMDRPAYRVNGTTVFA